MWTTSFKSQIFKFAPILLLTFLNVNSTWSLAQEGLSPTLAVPSILEVPPAPGTFHQIFYNVTPEGLILKFESNLNSSNLLDPIQFNQNLKVDLKSQNVTQQTQPPVGSIQIILEVEEKFQNFIKDIEKQIEIQNGVLNETFENFNKKIQNGSTGLQKLITDVKTQKSSGLQDLIKKISSDTQLLLDKIRGGFDAFGKGFKELTNSILDTDPNVNSNVNDTIIINITEPHSINSNSNSTVDISNG